MDKSIGILDKDYALRVKELVMRYRGSQIFHKRWKIVFRLIPNYLAQYALESSSQPLGISEYELEKLYPEKVEGTMPSVKEIEAKLDGRTDC